LLMSDEFSDVLETVDLLLCEREALGAGRIRLTIQHRYQLAGSDCLPGEEVSAALLAYRGREFPIRLSSRGLLLLDYLARQHLGQTATQITRAMQHDAFCRKHGVNAGRVRLPREVARSTVKVHIERLRAALSQTFREARIPLDPYVVLASESMSSNEAAYRLRAVTTWIHLDHPGPELHG